MATITIQGLGSGTDWAEIIAKLVELEHYQVNRLNTWKTTWDSKITSIQGLNSRLLSLELFVNDYNATSEFLATAATSSNETVLTATSTSSAIPAAHSVTIGSNIPHKLTSQGVATSPPEISSRNGTMTINVGTSHIHVPVTNVMTLSELQSEIQTAGSSILTAEIIDDGSSSNPKRLSITAKTGGSSNLVSVTANPTDLTFSENWINPVVNGAVWTGDSQAVSSGYYLGSSDKTYTFTVPTVTLNGANGVTSVTWSRSPGGAGNTGSFIIPANYAAETEIAVDGEVNNVVHGSSWTGASKATSGGNYTGSLEKFYTFTVPTGTVGTGDLTVPWSESTTGRTGTITIPDPYVAGTAINVDGVNSVVENSGWTGTSDATSSGNYTDTTNQNYTFTVQSVNGGAGTGIVGTDVIVIHWQNTDNSTTGNITLNGVAYTPGTAMTVENGLQVSFAAGTLSTDAGNTFTVDTEQGPTVSFSDGTLVNGNTFSVDARTGLKVSFSSGTLVDTEEFDVDTFANVDSKETGIWTGTSVTSAGHYLGSSNKTFNFTVLNSGTLGTDQIGIQWSDTEGNLGAITLPNKSIYSTGIILDVYQGLKINLTAGTLVAGDDFSIDVYSPNLQAGQNEGLAQVEQAVHSGFPDTNTTVVTTTNAAFSLVYGGKRFSIDVDADTTLTGLVSLINADTSNPGVTASILDDGLGLSTSYHLILAGRNSGAPYTIIQIQDTFTGDTFSSGGFETTQKAQSSMLKVDGYPSDSSQYIQRLTNSVSDVITGVNLSLVSSGSATVSIAEDLATIKNNINTFVSSVNFVLDYVKDQTKYDAETDEAGIMLGNYSYQIVRQRINNILTSSIPGLTDGVDLYTHLSQIGIKTNPDNDGKWEVNSTTLDYALATHYAAVAKLFTKDEVTGTNGVFELLSQELEKLNDSEDGPMNILVKSYGEIIDGVDSRIEREERRIALVEGRLTEQFTALDVLLGQLTGQETYLESLIAKLPTIGGNK